MAPCDYVREQTANEQHGGAPGGSGECCVTHARAQGVVDPPYDCALFVREYLVAGEFMRGDCDVSIEGNVPDDKSAHQPEAEPTEHT